MHPMTAWFFAMMLYLVPNGYDGSAYYVPENIREPRQDMEDRFEAIATDVKNLVESADEDPLFTGKNGRLKTGALLLSIAFRETGFTRAADFAIGTEGRGDGGRSWCLMQIQLGKKKVCSAASCYEDSSRTTREGWSGRELVQQRTKCFATALHILRDTWGCGTGGERLTPYASGQCVTKRQIDNALGMGDEGTAKRLQRIHKVATAQFSIYRSYVSTHEREYVVEF